MEYFNSNALQDIINKLDAIVFLNSYDNFFKSMINTKFSFFFHKKEDSIMIQVLQKLFIDKAYELRVPESEIDKNLTDEKSFTGWIRVALDNSEEMRKELIYKYRNNPFLLEAHKMFMNSLDIVCKDYNIDNYTVCIMYFDSLWDELNKRI